MAKAKKIGKSKKPAAPKITKPKAAPKKGGDLRVLLLDGKTAPSSAAMLAGAAWLGVENFPGGGPREQVDALRGELALVLEKERGPSAQTVDARIAEDPTGWTACHRCGEVAPEAMDACPYCGDEGESTTPSVEAEPVGSALVTQADMETKLNAHVARIKSLYENVAGNAYDLGVELRAIHEAELWKAKQYKSFKDFVERELTISRVTAYSLIETTKAPREDYLRLGRTRLALIQSSKSEEERRAMLDAANRGATSRDLQRMRQQTRKTATTRAAVDESSGAVKATTRVPAAPTPGPVPTQGTETRGRPNKNEQTLTLLTKLGGAVQKLRFVDRKTGKQVDAWRPESYARLQLSQDTPDGSAGVWLYVAPIFGSKKQMTGIAVRFVREAPKAKPEK